MDLSEVEKNEEKCESEDQDDTIFKSLDAEMIRKNLKAAHVKVHIDNLIPPKDGHSIRAISDKHVQDLVKSFRKSFDPYTVLIGLASTKADISKMSIPNQEPVEILGGNHTVAALKQLAGENSEAYKNVYMDIYTNLTEAQALSLSYKHNELHENSQELSFSEKVVFFRTSFLKNKEKHAGKPQKHISMRWRSEIGAILNKSKMDLKNSYKVHFSLAAYDEDVWNSITDVFHAFENHEIKGQKKTEKCTQYCFANFSKVKVNSEKIMLLKKLSTGKITPEEFRSSCLSGGKNNEKTTVSQATKRKSQQNIGSKPDEVNVEVPLNNSKSEKRTETNKDDNDDLKEKMEDLGKQLKDTNRELENSKQKIKQLSKQLQEMEKETQLKDAQLENKDKQIKKLKKKIIEIMDVMQRMKALDNKSKTKIDELQKSLKEEKDRCQLAEEAAARARTTEKAPVVEHSLKRKSDTSQTEDIVQKKMKRQESVQDKQPSGSSVIITEEKDLVLVEYTKGKIYFAIKDGDFLTYCQRPVGVIRDGHFTHAPQKLSFTVNEKDRQSFDEKYIICSMKGKLVGKCIKADQLSISIENQMKAIHKYIN